MKRKKFWQLPLSELNQEEWEALCDGCGQCCLVKLEDIDTGKIALTEVACELFDAETCQCSDYSNRFEKVHDCLNIQSAMDEKSLPQTCAYRLKAEGKSLYDWHYLISDDKNSVHEASLSMQHRTVCENKIPNDEYPNYIIRWIS